MKTRASIDRIQLDLFSKVGFGGYIIHRTFVITSGTYEVKPMHRMSMLPFTIVEKRPWLAIRLIRLLIQWQHSATVSHWIDDLDGGIWFSIWYFWPVFRQIASKYLKRWWNVQAMMKGWGGFCGRLDQYGMQYSRLFANMCNAGISVDAITDAAQKVCIPDDDGSWETVITDGATIDV